MKTLYFRNSLQIISHIIITVMRKKGVGSLIYTATLNPAIDLVIVSESLEPNKVNRTKSFELQPNGKGVNVSFILKKLNVDSIATGIGGGFTLDFVRQGLKDKGIKEMFLRTDAPTRVNVFTRVLNQGVEYKEVNPGPEISHEMQMDYLKLLEDNLHENDSLVVSGSFSSGIDESYLVDLAKLCEVKKVKLIVDSSYSVVKDILKYHPFLLKPNDDELASWFGIDSKLNSEQIVHYAKEVVKQGCENVLVSRGGDGAILVSKDMVLEGNAPKIQILNTAGAGDTMLGTFLGYLEKGYNKEQALEYAIAAGSDTASRTWLTNFENLDKLLNQIVIKKGSLEYAKV